MVAGIINSQRLFNVLNVLETGAVRLPLVATHLYGLALVGIITGKACGDAASAINGGFNRVQWINRLKTKAAETGSEYTPKEIITAGQFIYTESGLKRAVDVMAELTTKDYGDLVKDAVPLLVFSGIGLWVGNKLLGRPHPLYNQILPYVSPFRLDTEWTMGVGIAKGLYDLRDAYLSWRR